MTAIETEKNAVKIARIVYQYKNVSWTPNNIGQHVSLTQPEIAGAITWLRKKKYIGGRSPIYLTVIGNEYVEGLAKNVSLVSAASEARFKEEALSGVAQFKSDISGFMVSKESELTAAVLPKVRRPITTTTPEDMMLERQKALKSKLYLARVLNLTAEELEQHIENGRVQYCKSCQSIQLFDRKNFKRWHSVCKKCRKERGV